MNQPPVKLTWRFRIGSILLVTLAAYSGWISFWKNDIRQFISRYEKVGSIGSNSISRFERKFSCLKDDLAPDERVGFISPYTGDVWTEFYYLTQYTIAPTIVTRDESMDKVIAVYPDKKSIDQVIEEGYIILDNCQNGIGLVTPAERQ